MVQSRRDFIKTMAAGAGAVAAVAVIPSSVFAGSRLAGVASPARSSKVDVRAVGGLPQGPFPSYATYVIEGTLDTRSQTGVLTKTVYAGPPEAMTTIALPGLSRVIRVTAVRVQGDEIHASGMVDERSQLMHGESSEVTVTLNRSSGVMKTRFLDGESALSLT